MNIQFLGAAQMVTGSLYYVEHEDRKFIVDCGMFQGSSEMLKLNLQEFPFDPKDIDFVILTHAHIDHSGRLPLLVKQGFSGTIYSTKPTEELSQVMLMDSAYIQEHDAEWENRKRERAGKEPLEPPYSVEDVKSTLTLFQSHLYDQWIQVDDNLRFRFRDAGHILGSAIVEIYYGEQGKETKLVFSGDLGMPDRPILDNPAVIESADYLVMESTYGNRNHESMDFGIHELTEIIQKTTQRGGSVIIPSFAVGRTQELIYLLNEYYSQLDDYSQKIPIYVDSPMAVEATRVFQQNSMAFDEQAKSLVLEGKNPFKFENLHYVKTVEESKLLNNSHFPKVIISASGMAEAGRIRHHLKHHLWDRKNSVVFVGYQAEGTLGRQLLEGAKQVKLLGEIVDVKAEIYDLEGFSAHADKKQLIHWLEGFKELPKKIIIVHGEAEPAHALAETIETQFHVPTFVPKMGDVLKIRDGEVFTARRPSMDVDAQRAEIEKQLALVYDGFGAMVRKSHLLYDDKFLKLHYYDVYNQLLSIQSELMDLNMIVGK